MFAMVFGFMKLTKLVPSPKINPKRRFPFFINEINPSHGKRIFPFLGQLCPLSQTPQVTLSLSLSLAVSSIIQNMDWVVLQVLSQHNYIINFWKCFYRFVFKGKQIKERNLNQHSWTLSNTHLRSMFNFFTQEIQNLHNFFINNQF